MRSQRPFALALAWIAVLGAAGVADSQNYAAQDPQNIVLLIADDMDWSDLPFFNPAIHWSTTPPTISATSLEIKEARLRSPDLNRSAARLMATSAEKLGHNPHENLPESEQPSRKIVPVDCGSSCAATNYFTEDPVGDNTGCTDTKWPNPSGTCTRNRDILKGHGGLRKLAANGVVMPRMYAASARCAPSRAALFTGRHQLRVGVEDNHNQLNARELTIAEFLKQGCQDDNGHACYRTALVGKWHLGSEGSNSPVSPWAKGFDEFVGFGGGSRSYTSGDPLRCSPVQKAPAAGAHMSEAVHPTYGRYCQRDLVDYPAATQCPNGDADCSAGWACGETTGKCFIKDLDSSLTKSCTETIECSNAVWGRGDGYTCQEHWLYIGPKDRDACPDQEADRNLLCCTKTSRNPEEQTIVGNPEGDKRGYYSFKHKRVRDASGTLRPVAFHTDGTQTKNPGDWNGGKLTWYPCSDDGSVFLEDRVPANFVFVDNDLVQSTGVNGAESVQTCLYSERFWRDVAKNFIKREKLRGAAVEPASSKPRRFFLAVSFHAVHDGHVPTERTRRHYETPSNLRPNVPNLNYWGILEELDAAIGTIMRTLEDEGLLGNTLVLFTNDNGSPTGGAYGLPSLRGSKQSVSDGGTRVGLLAYGAKVGACRASTGGTCDTAEVAGDFKQRTVTALGSHVDLFPTIADAAGYDVAGSGEGELGTDYFDANDPGRLIARVCDTADELGNAVPCTSAADCQPSGCGTGSNPACGQCVVRGLDGRSLLKTLKEPGITDTTARVVNSPERTQVFTSYPASGEPGMAVITKEGRFQSRSVCDTDFDDQESSFERTGCNTACDTNQVGGVDQTEADACLVATGTCGYQVDAVHASDQTIRTGRVVQGSSCTSCTSPANCGAQTCEIVGKVCSTSTVPVPDACIAKRPNVAAGEDDTFCNIDTATRCQSDTDCPGGVCVAVRIECGATLLGASTACSGAWKGLSSSTNADASTEAQQHVGVADLFEMKNNAEEEERKLPCATAGCVSTDYDGELDCEYREGPTAIEQDRFDRVVGDLNRQLGCWHNCTRKSVKDAGGNPVAADLMRCDDVYDSPSTDGPRCAAP